MLTSGRRLLGASNLGKDIILPPLGREGRVTQVFPPENMENSPRTSYNPSRFPKFSSPNVLSKGSWGIIPMRELLGDKVR